MIRRFVVHGLVQGVGFRWYTRRAGERLALRGWVRNREDGTVEVVAAGEDEALESLMACLADGPPGARVTKVENVEISGDMELPTHFFIKG